MGMTGMSAAGSRVGIEQDCSPPDVWRNLREQFEPLTGEGRVEVSEAGRVAARPRDARNEAATHGV